MTIYLGKVSYDLHKSASRVRVSIPGTDDIPLSVKASLNYFPREAFVKGTVVEVEQCQHDGRRFRVTQVFDEFTAVNFNVNAPDAKALNKGEEKVKFYLGSKYFENHKMKDILRRAFNLSHNEYHKVIRRGSVHIICTTDQFARFLIDRNLNGIKNGFMDLNPRLIRPEPKPDAYQILADTVGITRDQAKKVALAISYSHGDLEDRLPHKQGLSWAVVDVSNR